MSCTVHNQRYTQGAVLLQRSDAVAIFPPIAAQLSTKSALLLAKNLATASIQDPCVTILETNVQYRIPEILYTIYVVLCFAVSRYRSILSIFFKVTSPNPVLDYFTVPLHSLNGRQLPAVRAVQRDCHWGLKNSWNPHWSREPIMQWGTGQSQSTFRPTNHKKVMPTNWRPCLIPHWQSYCHQARTV